MPRLVVLSCLLLGILAMASPFANAEDAPKKPEKLLRHVVLVKFKADATKEQVQEIVHAFRELPKMTAL